MLAVLLLMGFGFGVFAGQSNTNMNNKKTLVLSYEFPSETVIKESTATLVKNSANSFHVKEKDVDVVLLGEKEKIVIPGIAETFLFFDKNFLTATLYVLPVTNWSTLETSIAQIKKVKFDLASLRKISKIEKEIDLNKINEEYFKDKASQTICIYELEHSKVILVLKKLDTPKEIHPRDQDYFQLAVRIDSNKI